MNRVLFAGFMIVILAALPCVVWADQPPQVNELLVRGVMQQIWDAAQAGKIAPIYVPDGVRSSVDEERRREREVEAQVESWVQSQPELACTGWRVIEGIYANTRVAFYLIERQGAKTRTIYFLLDRQFETAQGGNVSWGAYTVTLFTVSPWVDGLAVVANNNPKIRVWKQGGIKSGPVMTSGIPYRAAR